MKKIGVIILALAALPAVASAETMGVPDKPGAQIGPVQTLTGQLVSGRVQEVESRFLKGISGNIEEMGRLRSDARRRNDSLAASCVEQKLTPAENMRSAAAKAGARLRGIPASDIEALNSEVRNISTAADRIGDLAAQARGCLKINSGQVVTNLKLTPDVEIDTSQKKERDGVADVIAPHRPVATDSD
jgi:hypothetical protein